MSFSGVNVDRARCGPSRIEPPTARIVRQADWSDRERRMDAKLHWQSIYESKGPDQLSWFQAEARLSRELIERFAPDRNTRILDVGAGASTLVDGLLAAGYRRLTVLDLSPAALAIYATTTRSCRRCSGLARGRCAHCLTHRRRLWRVA